MPYCDVRRLAPYPLGEALSQSRVSPWKMSKNRLTRVTEEPASKILRLSSSSAAQLVANFRLDGLATLKPSKAGM